MKSSITLQEVGHLGFPKMELKPGYAMNDLMRAAFNHHQDFLTTAQGAAVLQRLKNDPRIVSLVGKLVAVGGGGIQFQIDHLACWFVWFANANGEKSAQECLDSWLNASVVETLAALWVVGIEPAESFEIADGYWLTRLEDMPDSNEKAEYLEQHIGFVPAAPRCAITKKYSKSKICADSPAIDKAEIAIGQALYGMAFILNFVESVLCVPYYQSAYSSASVPPAFFGGSGGGKPLYDVFTHRSRKVDKEISRSASELFSAFVKMPVDEQERFTLIASRLSQAKRRLGIEDAILDLGIALEMLLLDDNKKEQLTLMFKLRGSWLLGENAEDRHKRWDLLGQIYDARSSVAHTGRLHAGKTAKVQAVRDQRPQYERLAEEVARKVLLQGKPDWQKLVLAGT